MTPSLDVLRAHADKLAAQLNITVREWHSSGGRAFTKARIVDVPVCNSEQAYAVRLHELGHCETDHARRWWPDFYRHGALWNSAGEAAAWRWARTHALAWTPTMQAALRWGLQHYRPAATGGSHDPLYSELDRLADGSLTTGYAQRLHKERLGIGPLSIAAAQARLPRPSTWAADRESDRWRALLDAL